MQNINICCGSVMMKLDPPKIGPLSPNTWDSPAPNTSNCFEP